ncbi:MAG: peptide-methionine (S)-S-oxide reductase [Dehalococcoidales bacterium]|nr:peptide-methionine (S)-S-oxide reductase [Dehalococcoidales bacterium]
MIHVRVGYAGGTGTSPTYYDLGGHAETVQINYDPELVSYEELLRVFWDSHGPPTIPLPSQYRSVVFYHDDEQHKLALAYKAHLEVELGRTVVTEIVPFSRFHLAEDYHQKYYLRQVPELLGEFRTMYPEVSDFASSTAAARINGFLGGHGTLQALEQQLPFFGLSPGTSSRLLEIGSRILPVVDESTGASCPVKG